MSNCINIVNSSVEFISEEDLSAASHIAKCARVCYGKEYKAPDKEKDEKMVDGLESRGHTSMFRHSSVYLKWDLDSDRITLDKLDEVNTLIKENAFSNNFGNYISCNYEKSSYDKIASILEQKNAVYNIIENKDFLKLCSKLPNLFRIYRMTFCFTTQIATSRELNRVSPNNIAERSTRYCKSNGNLNICKPHWWDEATDKVKEKYLESCETAQETYDFLLKNGLKPEDARGVLPLDTLTKVIYTYPIWKWQDILDNRLYDKTGKAHPNCHIVMAMLKKQINTFAKEHNIEYTV